MVNAAETVDSSAMKTPLTDLLGIEHPLIQAPMAGVSTPAMAAAVSNAGALGSVALGALNAAAARTALAETRALTDRPFAANVFVHATPVADPDRERRFLAEIRPAFEAAGGAVPNRLREIYRSFNDDDDLFELLLEVRPAVVSLHFGPADSSRMSALKQAGIPVLATATTVAEAQMLEERGVDALVIQGSGAGGHSGAFLGAPDPQTAGLQGLTDCIRAVSARVSVPVIAAGGIMDGGDVRAVLAAGAAGAQLGTAFVACLESLASPSYRQALTGTAGTSLTANLSGRPARGLDNELMDWARSISSEPPDYPLTYDAIKQLVAARATPEFAVMWAGEGASRARSMPAYALVRQIVREMD